MRITSTRNPVVKEVLALQRPAIRRQETVFLAEGTRLVDEARRTGQAASIALYDPDALSRSAAGSSLMDSLPAWAERCYEVDEHVLRAVADTETPAGVVVVLRHRESGPLSAPTGLAVVLDRLSDPGNAGTILRAAAAFGVDTVVTVPGTVDLFSPKAVRAGMGAHFRISVHERVAWPDFLSAFDGAEIIAAEAAGGESLPEFAWPRPAALVVGSEAAGLSEEAGRAATRRVYIPMERGVESLNAAVAASIFMYAAKHFGYSERDMRYT